MRRTVLNLLGGALIAATMSPASADTLAYWRFDDRADGDKLDAEQGTDRQPFTTIEDASGHGNFLRTFNTRADQFPPDTSGRIHASPLPPSLAGGVANVRFARFTGEEDFYTSEAKDVVPPINSATLKTFTVEGLFKLDALSRRWADRAQAIVGKNGRPVAGVAWQPFCAVVIGRDSERFARDCLAVNLLDASGTYRVATSRKPLVAGQWYAFAAVCDGTTLKLHVNRFDGAGYQLEGESPVTGGMIASTDSWAVGRGAYEAKPNSWLQGSADEIRIDDAALPPERWLTARVNTLPTPATQPSTTQATQPTTRPLRLVRHFADPEVLVHDGVYYLYGTGDAAGFDAWSSRDLITWTKHVDALRPGAGVWGDASFWAPGAIGHRGKFYLYYSTSGVMPDNGGRRSVRINVAVADAPTGPFREVVARLPLIGRAAIDPQAFVDRDGRAYLYFVADVSENNGSGQVYVARLSDDLLATVGEPVPCIAPSQAWEGTTWNEGPFVFRDGDAYVMTYSGNFWGSHDYAVGVATAPTPTGPWKKRDDNPFLSRYAGLFGTGHNSIARSPDGKDWLIFFHAHRDARRTLRDTYVAKLVVERDARGDVRLSVKPWRPEAAR